MTINIYMIVLCFNIGCCIYALFRMRWASKQVIFLLLHDLDSYSVLPHEEIIAIGHGFWRWDIQYFVRYYKKKNTEKSMLRGKR